MNTVYEKLRNESNAPIEKVLSDVRIICADDNENTLGLLETYCSILGWKGVYTTTALGILDALNESDTDFDAIIADINFKTESGPDVTGITVARTIRKVRPNLPIIFVSGYASSNIIREEVRRVNASVMTKPVDFEKLFTEVARMIYWHRLSIADAYTGKERRKTSINVTGWARRKTDCHLTPSQAVIDSKEAKNANG